MIEISEYLANKIVKEMKKIIEQDLNFINLNGIIIASTDKKRVGSFHEGALKCIKENIELVILDDNEYKGAKKGINIPISCYDETVGVIGITGDKDKVIKYGYIIKLMTEILVKESIYKENKRNNDRYIIESLINKNYDFLKMPFKNYRLIVIKAKDEYLKNITKDIIYTHIFNKIFMLVKENGALNFLNKFENCIISEVITNYNEFEKEYEKISYYLEYSKKFNLNYGQVYTKNLDLEYLLVNLKQENIHKYLLHVFDKCDLKKIIEFKKIFLEYKKNNGSINLCAKNLFLHKNTVQYKLNQIKLKTGYDPRKLKDFMKLDLAFMLIN